MGEGITVVRQAIEDARDILHLIADDHAETIIVVATKTHDFSP
jgi:hypothetical protein